MRRVFRGLEVRPEYGYATHRPAGAVGVRPESSGGAGGTTSVEGRGGAADDQQNGAQMTRARSLILAASICGILSAAAVGVGYAVRELWNISRLDGIVMGLLAVSVFTFVVVLTLDLLADERRSKGP